MPPYLMTQGPRTGLPWIPDKSLLLGPRFVSVMEDTGNLCQAAGEASATEGGIDQSL